MGARSQLWGLCGWTEEGGYVVGIGAQRTRERFPGNSVRLSPWAAFPTGSLSGSTAPVLTEIMRMELSHLAGRVGRGGTPGSGDGVSESVHVVGGGLSLGNFSKCKDNLGRH